MKAYEKFLRDAGKPIGIAGAWVIGIAGVIWFSIWLFGTSPTKKAFAEACTLRGGTVEEVTKGAHFCAKVTRSTEILPPDWVRYKAQCRAANGLPISRYGIAGCYIFEIIMELGPQDAYVGG